MSGPYDVTHTDFMARVTGYAMKRREAGSKVWKARLHAILYGASFRTLSTIRTLDDAVDEMESRKAGRAAFLSEFGSLVHKAYRETFRRLP